MSAITKLPYYNELVKVVGSTVTAKNEIWWMIESICKQSRPILQQQQYCQHKQHKQLYTDTYNSIQTQLNDLQHILSSQQQHKQLQNMLYQRAVHRIPLQYLLGNTMFLGLEINVRPPTLIPRPETEELTCWTIQQLLNNKYQQSTKNLQTYQFNIHDMIQLLEHKSVERTTDNTYQLNKKHIDTAFNNHIRNSRLTPQQLQHHSTTPQYNLKQMYQLHTQASTHHNNDTINIIDMCCGSGNIALSTAQYLQQHQKTARIVGIDYASDAIQLSNENAVKHNLQDTCTFLQNDVYNNKLATHIQSQIPHWQRADIIISNPPYLAHNEYFELEPELESEDFNALVAGHTGTELHQAIIKQSIQLLKPVDTVPHSDRPELVLEIGGEYQCNTIINTLQQFEYQHITMHQDSYGKTRWIAAARQVMK